jgi:hypothetical protein
MQCRTLALMKRVTLSGLPAGTSMSSSSKIACCVHKTERVNTYTAVVEGTVIPRRNKDEPLDLKPVAVILEDVVMPSTKQVSPTFDQYFCLNS